MRICDVQPTDTESDALAALIVGCVQRAARDVAEGVPFADPPARLIEENLWRAIRHGMDGSLIDLASGEQIPAREVLERTAQWAGVDLALPERTSAQRQRELLADGASIPDVYAAVVGETQRTYGRAATIA
jgi:carboxylate-amine ligase